MTDPLKDPDANRSLDGKKQENDSFGVYGGSSIHPLFEDARNGRVNDPRRTCRDIGLVPGKKSADS